MKQHKDTYTKRSHVCDATRLSVPLVLASCFTPNALGEFLVMHTSHHTCLFTVRTVSVNYGLFLGVSPTMYALMLELPPCRFETSRSTASNCIVLQTRVAFFIRR